MQLRKWNKILRETAILSLFLKMGSEQATKKIIEFLA